MIRADSRVTERGIAQNIEAEESDEGRLNDSFQHPHKIVLVVEDTVLLSDEVDLRKEPIEVLIKPVSLREILLLL